MRVWTIQPLSLWTALRRDGVVYVREDDPKYRGYIPPAYRWMQSQLTNIIPGYSGFLPWWGHCGKPDIRKLRHRESHRAEMVRLELVLPKQQTKSFPCWAWHRVYCQDYLATSEVEYFAWRKALNDAVPDIDAWPLPEPWQTEVVHSWTKLFATNLASIDWDRTSLWSNHECREVVFEELRREDVKGVTTFTGVGSM